MVSPGQWAGTEQQRRVTAGPGWTAGSHLVILLPLISTTLKTLHPLTDPPLQQSSMTSKIIKKTIEEANGVQNAEIDFSDKQLVSLEPDMTRLWSMKNITRLTLSHNKVNYSVM